MAGAGYRGSGHDRAGVAVIRVATGRASVDVERRVCARYAQDGEVKAIEAPERDGYY